MGQVSSTMRPRIYVLYGQYGLPFSIGMFQLSRRAAALGCTVTTHSHSDGQAIVDDWRRTKPPVTILIGYSLGANAIPRIAYAIYSEVALAVMYDPSIYGERVNPFPPTIKRALLYHNTGPYGYGHLIVEGPQVERTDVATSHLAVCFREDLHQKTLAAIAKLIGSPNA